MTRQFKLKWHRIWFWSSSWSGIIRWNI